MELLQSKFALVQDRQGIRGFDFSTNNVPFSGYISDAVDFPDSAQSLIVLEAWPAGISHECVFSEDTSPQRKLIFQASQECIHLVVRGLKKGKSMTEVSRKIFKECIKLSKRQDEQKVFLLGLITCLCAYQMISEDVCVIQFFGVSVSPVPP